MHVAKSFDEFNESLRLHQCETGTKYVFYKGPKSFTSGQIVSSSKTQLHWEDNIPYFHFGTRTYVCHQGKDINKYQKKRYAEKRDAQAETENVLRKRYNLTKVTKKLNCPARIKVTRMVRMPEYQITGPVTVRTKNNASRRLKTKLTGEGQVAGDEVYVFNLPDISEHKNHVLNISSIITESIDSLIVNVVEVKSEPD